jgi:hypothetical protein
MFSRKRFTGFAVSGRNLPRMKKDNNTGASVTTSIASTAMINVLVYARGPNNFPSCPVNKNTGRNEAMIITVEKNTPRDTILQELSIILIRTSSGIFT